MSTMEVATKTISSFPLPAQIIIYVSAAAGLAGTGAALYKAVQTGCNLEYTFVDGRKVAFSTGQQKENANDVVVDGKAMEAENHTES